MTRIRRVRRVHAARSPSPSLFISSGRARGRRRSGVDHRQRRARGRVAEDPAAARRRLRGRGTSPASRRATPCSRSPSRPRPARPGTPPRRSPRSQALQAGGSGPTPLDYLEGLVAGEHRPGRGGEDRRPRERAARDRPDRVRLGRTSSAKMGGCAGTDRAHLQRTPLPRHRAAVAVRSRRPPPTSRRSATRNRRMAVGDSTGDNTATDIDSDTTALTVEALIGGRCDDATRRCTTRWRSSPRTSRPTARGSSSASTTPNSTAMAILGLTAAGYDVTRVVLARHRRTRVRGQRVRGSRRLAALAATDHRWPTRVGCEPERVQREHVSRRRRRRGDRTVVAPGDRAAATAHVRADTPVTPTTPAHAVVGGRPGSPRAAP